MYEKRHKMAIKRALQIVKNQINKNEIHYFMQSFKSLESKMIYYTIISSVFSKNSFLGFDTAQ